jgi:hypothetical protein
LLRDLRVFNGVVEPAIRVAEADTLPAPPPPHVSPADRFLARCPTADEIELIDADFRLSFEYDPTSGEPPVCTAAAGSRDLSPLRHRVYGTLLLVRRLLFDRPLPWTTESLYRWLTAAITGIRFRGDIRTSFCCDPARVINLSVSASSSVAQTDRWADPATRGGLDGFLLLLAHEARHAEGHPHTCGPKDQTVDELGAWGVQYYLARWLAEHTDQAFFSSGRIRYPRFLLESAEALKRVNFCRP